MIQAINTTHKGYAFRSRLEARWAVFFDALGIAYDYETEGLVVGGQPYLPDFWLPEYSAFVEIKRRPADEDEPDMVRALILQSLMQAAGVTIYILAGQPWPDEYTLIRPALRGEFTHCALATQSGTGLPCYVARDGSGWGVIGGGGTDATPRSDSPAMLAAYSSARRARFDGRRAGVDQ